MGAGVVRGRGVGLFSLGDVAGGGGRRWATRRVVVSWPSWVGVGVRVVAVAVTWRATSVAGCWGSRWVVW